MAIHNISTAARNAMADALVDLIDGGTTDAGGDLQIGTDSGGGTFGTVLAELDFSNPAYGPASTGVAQENAISDETNAPATGTAALCRVRDRDNTVIFEGTVGATGSGADIELSSTAITAGDNVSVTDLPVTMPAS